MDFERLPDTAWKKLTAYMNLASRVRVERTSRLFFAKFSQSWDEITSIHFQVAVDESNLQANFAIAQCIQQQVDSCFKRCFLNKIVSVQIDASDVLYETVLEILEACIGLQKFQVHAKCRCWMQLAALQQAQFGFYESLMLQCPTTIVELDILFGVRIVHTGGIIGVQTSLELPNFQSANFVNLLGARLINLRRLRFCSSNAMSTSDEAALRALCTNLTDIVVQQ